jgi:predicted dinucleotide-binding enzyme
MSLAVIGSGRYVHKNCQPNVWPNPLSQPAFLRSVGGALAAQFLKQGKHVVLAARDPSSDKTKAALAETPGLTAVSMVEAVKAASMVFVCCPYPAVADCVKGLDLNGKIVVNCTNPVGPGLTHAGGGKGGGEIVQELLPNSQVVNCFNIYGYENFRNTAYPNYGPLKPAMMLCGNDASAKSAVVELVAALGFEPVDVGDIKSSIHLEHMCLMWVKMGRVQGKGPNFTWGMLQRE